MGILFRFENTFGENRGGVTLLVPRYEKNHIYGVFKLLL